MKENLVKKTRVKKPVDPNTIATGWTIDLDYGPPDDPGRSGYMCSRDTLDEVLQDMIKYSMYYMGLGYVVTVKKINQYCRSCEGRGSWRIKMMSPKRKTCRVCGGAGTFKSVLGTEGFLVKLSEASTILNDAK